MNALNNLIFVCQSTDEAAMTCLISLQKAGYQTKVLLPGELAPVGSVAFYTGFNEQWPSKCLRVAAHRLYEGRPKWAINTPYLVAVKPFSRGNAAVAALELARIYDLWLKGDAGVIVPWETTNGRPSTHQNLIEDWLNMVAEIVGTEELTMILASQKSLDRTKGFGGDIVYRHLYDSGRVLLSPNGSVGQLPSNQIYEQLTGRKSAWVSYGTSDLANLFEFLEALKLGQHLGLPVVFETYPGAHSVGTYLNGFLNPSLHIFGTKTWASAFGLEGSSKYMGVVPAEVIPKLISSTGLQSIEPELTKWANQPLWKIYQNAMGKVADIVMQLLGFSVPYAFTTTEQICQASGVWAMQAQEIADTVQHLNGHPVAVFNRPDGTKLMSDQRMPVETVGELHKKGWWLGGSVLYWMIFRLGQFGGVVVMVKDSTAGRVNLTAREFFSEKSDLHVSPVGLFRLSAEIQNEDWSIDPLVFLALLKEWDPEKAREEVQKIWNAMEVPLAKEHIGWKTVAKVTRGGVQIRVQSC